jgi:hypothetical protein
VNDSKLVMPDKGAKGRPARPPDRAAVWALLGWIGMAFVVVGGVDFALAWYPPEFGNREWEFGTVTASFNGLPIVVLGLGLLLTSSLQTGRRWLGLLAALGCFGLFAWVVAGVVIYGTNVPLALSAVPPEVLTGMKKAVVRTAVQSVAYPVLLAYLGWRSIGAVRGQTFGSGSDKA